MDSLHDVARYPGEASPATTFLSIVATLAKVFA
jgi:hypothetical protein